MKKVKIFFVTTISILVVVFSLIFAGCDMFASDYQIGIKLAKKASNIEATQMTYSRNRYAGLSNIIKDVYMRDGDVILKYEQEIDYINGATKDSKTYWYAKVENKYFMYSSGVKEEINKETYDSVAQNLNTGDVVSEIEFYSDNDHYTFGFLESENGEIKDFRLIYDNRAVVKQWGFKDNKLIYKNDSSNHLYEYSYDKITLSECPILK